MRFVARSTSSAPTFFEPKQHQEKEKAYIDGAVFANNPAMCAYAHAQSLGFDEDDMTVVSLGTGSISRDIRYEEAKDWGLVNWARPLFDITSQASNLSIDWQLTHILRKAHYFRIAPIFKDGRSAIDDARPENMAAVREIGMKMIAENSAIIDELCVKIS
jgi:predicted acylesterase/phospholipase RssA